MNIYIYIYIHIRYLTVCFFLFCSSSLQLLELRLDAQEWTKCTVTCGRGMRTRLKSERSRIQVGNSCKGVSKVMGVPPIAGWFMRENPTEKWMMTGGFLQGGYA